MHSLVSNAQAQGTVLDQILNVVTDMWGPFPGGLISSLVLIESIWMIASDDNTDMPTMAYISLQHIMI
jgi:hypothetical protein